MSTKPKTTTADSAETIGTVVLGFGPQPLDWLTKASKACGKGAVIAPDIARMAGANLAAGDPAALDLLRSRLEAGAIDATAEQHPSAAQFRGGLRWLALGERGLSSDALFQCLTGVKIVRNKHDATAHPLDPADLRRCILMLETVRPGTDRSTYVADMSNEWAKLQANWRTLVDTFEAECPNWRGKGPWDAPKTYALMKQILS